MFKHLTLIGIATFVVCAAPAAAYAENHAPICVAKTIVLGIMPDGVDMKTIDIDPVKMGACSDVDMDTLTLVSVSAPATLDNNNQAVIPYPDGSISSITIAYTVSDGNGDTASSTLTLSQN